MNAVAGWVYLVGAGPGDPGLITRRGLELLSSADVVLYDRLVAKELLGEARADALLVYVGKSRDGIRRSQSSIDALLIEHATTGRSVVRLKGGDPFLFGRGADEAQALGAAGVPFEIVPGVTSAVAVPAYAGIPVTHSGLASSLAIASAHDPDRELAGWKEMATGADTLVLLMGVTALRITTERLIEAGRDPAQPAALVQWGSTPRQRTVVGTLADIADAAERENVGPPSALIVGEVVGLRSALNWFEARPLFGQRVVVTRPRTQSHGLRDLLTSLGAEIVSLPVIETVPPESWDELDSALARLEKGVYSWVVFNSATAVEKMWERARNAGQDARLFAGARIAAVGRATGRALEQHGLKPDLVPEEFTGVALAQALGGGEGKVLLPRAQGAPTDQVDVLRDRGWEPEEVPAYRTVAARPDPDALARVKTGEFDVVTFTSASTVRFFVEIAGAPRELGLGPESLSDKAVACIGPVTARAAEQAGFRVDVVATEHTSEGLASALVQWRSGRAR